LLDQHSQIYFATLKQQEETQHEKKGKLILLQTVSSKLRTFCAGWRWHSSCRACWIDFARYVPAWGCCL